MNHFEEISHPFEEINHPKVGSQEDGLASNLEKTDAQEEEVADPEISKQIEELGKNVQDLKTLAEGLEKGSDQERLSLSDLKYNPIFQTKIGKMIGLISAIVLAADLVIGPNIPKEILNLELIPNDPNSSVMHILSAVFWLSGTLAGNRYMPNIVEKVKGSRLARRLNNDFQGYMHRGIHGGKTEDNGRPEMNY